MSFDAPAFKGELLEYRAQNRWLAVIMVLAMTLVGFRFFQLQVLGGKKYEKLAEVSQVKRVRIPARRGEIFDRHGRAVARNVDLYRVVLIPHYVEDIDDELSRVKPILQLTQQEVDQARGKYHDFIQDKKKRFREVTIKEFVNGRFCPVDGTRLDEVASTPQLWCPACGRQYLPAPKGQTECPFDHARLEISADGKRASCPVCQRHFVYGKQCPEEGSDLVPVEHDLHCPRCMESFSDAAAVLLAHGHEFPGIEVREQIIRAYPFRDLFAHVVGYVSEVTRDEITRHPGVYLPGEMAGRRGVEKYMEEVLRGKAGEEVAFRDTKGRRLEVAEGEPTLANLKYEAPVPGNDVVLTIDMEIQQVLKDALARTPSGGIVVMDADTGEILGLYSTPSFDPNEWAGRLTSERKKEYDENPYSPMVNKATTAFPPGSTFKMVTAIAALNEGVVTPDTTVNCPGYYDYAGRRFNCYNRYGHGDVDLRRAIPVSCDVYFYRLGEWLGMDRLESYATRFGLGRRTGLEIGEDAGTVPSREWHELHSKGGFQPGFTLSTAVGQKDIRATPVQMALVQAQVVNGGRVLHPFLVDRVEDGRGGVVRSLRKVPDEDLGIPLEYLDFVKQAMAQAVEDEEGTGHTAALESIRVGGKTGTAEARQVKKGVDPVVAQWLKEDHAWFVAFAPVEHPRIAVACIIEHGGYGGAVAAPVVAKVIYKLFSKHLVPGAGEGR